MNIIKLISAIMKIPDLTVEDIDRIIQMAWEDRTPFEAKELPFGLPEKDMIALMRTQVKASNFKMWRKRTNGRTTKHKSLGLTENGRFKSTLQKSISGNKISKR